MPAPLLLALPFIEALIVNILAWANTIYGVHLVVDKIEQFLRSDLFFNFVQGGIGGIARDVVFEQTGLQLDPENPFTKASIANAVSVKTGIYFEDITDAPKVKRDIGVHVTARINSVLGTELENVTTLSLDELRTQMEGQILAQLEAALSAGSSPMFSAPAIAQLATLIADYKGMTLTGAPPEDDPPEVNAKRTRNRLAQRRYYAQMKADGYTRKYVPPSPP